MEPVLDRNKNIVKVLINKKYYNNYSIFKQEYMKNLNFIEDKKILNILKCSYLYYGIITKEMIEGIDPSHNLTENEFYFKNIDIIEKSNYIEHPEKLFNRVNLILNYTNNYCELVNSSYNKIMEYDIQILNLLSKLKKEKFLLYLEHLVTYNNIRLFINLVFFEYYQDMNFINNKLLQYKNDYFILEQDIYKLNYDLNNLLENYKENKTFILCIDNKKINFKVVKGELDIISVLNIIEDKVNKLRILVS